jgi:hypothetical protein
MHLYTDLETQNLLKEIKRTNKDFNVAGFFKEILKRRYLTEEETVEEIRRRIREANTKIELIHHELEFLTNKEKETIIKLEMKKKAEEEEEARKKEKESRLLEIRAKLNKEYQDITGNALTDEMFIDCQEHYPNFYAFVEQTVGHCILDKYLKGGKQNG